MLIELQKELSKILTDTLGNLYQINETMSGNKPNIETLSDPCNLIEETRDNLNKAKEVHDQVLMLKEMIGGKK